MSLNRVIGNGDKIPWHVPEDFQWFKRVTLGHILLMGRKTYASIGRPLPGRETVVLSRSAQTIPGVRVVSSLGDLDFSQEKRDIFVCGGAEIYAQLLPTCADLYLTLIKREVVGDVFFPAFEDRFVAVEVVQETDVYRITRYRNRDFPAASI